MRAKSSTRLVLGLWLFASIAIVDAANVRPPSQDQAQGESYFAAEWWVAYATFALFCATTALWYATYRLHKGAESAARQTGSQMSEQIAAAVASHQAMTEVAEATRNNALTMGGLMQKQFRAYISADFPGTDGATYQDHNLRFGGRVVMNNRGFTPAHNVSYWIAARVFKPDAVELVRPVGVPLRMNDATMTPRQEFVIAAEVDARYSDDEVAAIMTGQSKRLYVFGEIKYIDIYEKEQVTKFCHMYVFSKQAQGVRTWPSLHSEHNVAS